MSQETEVFKLKLDEKKVVEAIDFLARAWPGITQYYVGKILYFADRNHCLDWGRTITGDRYVAMEHGPVPSRVYDLLKVGSGEDDELLDAITARLAMEQDGNKIRIYSKTASDFAALSKSDIEHLSAAHDLCRSLSFQQLRDISHEDLAWQKANERGGNAPPMDLTLWFEQSERSEAGVYLREHAKYGV